MRRTREKYTEGFTLIEVILVVGLSAFLLMILYSTYFAINRAIDAASQGQEVLETGRILMELQRQDLRGTMAQDLRGTTASALFPFICDMKEIDGEPYYTIEFVSTSLMGDNPFGVGKVGYSLIKTREGQKVFIRRELKTVKEDLNKYGTVFEVSKLVKSYELSFYNGTEWVEKWDSRSSGRLPRQVRISFTLDDGKGNKKVFITDETIPGAM
jgi:type II secretion system protein J